MSVDLAPSFIQSPLEDCLYALQPTIPDLTRSSLPPAARRQPVAGGGRQWAFEEKVHGLSDRLLRHRLCLYVAIDRTSKFALCNFVGRTGRTSASAFLEALIAAVPYKIHRSHRQRDQFNFPPRHAGGPTASYVTHMFNLRCQENGIEHRLTRIKHPSTNGEVEPMNRTIKEAIVQRYH